jgi:hypothetical protein
MTEGKSLTLYSDIHHWANSFGLVSLDLATLRSGVHAGMLIDVYNGTCSLLR